MKVLVAGLTNPENQFTRGLRKLGCDPVHTNADAGPFPRDADAVIIVMAQLNKNKMFKIREAYEGRPILVARDSFSQISSQFQDIMFKHVTAGKKLIVAPPPQPKHYEPKPKFSNSLAEAFKAIPSKPEEPAPAPTPAPSVEPETEMKFGRPSHTSETVQRVYRIVQECKDANLSTKETVEMLAAENLRKANGNPYDIQSVYAMISNLKTGKYKLEPIHQEVKAAVPEPKPAPPAPQPTQLSLVIQAPQPPPAPAKAPPVVEVSQLQLIEQLMKTEMDPREKLELIAKIQSGKIKEIERTEVELMELGKQDHLRILKSSIFRKAAENPEVVLSKAQCELILSNIGILHNFVATGKP